MLPTLDLLTGREGEEAAGCWGGMGAQKPLCVWLA